MFFATSAMPCWCKKSTNMVPRALQKQLSNQHPNLHRFWNQLGSILGGFWEPSWNQVGTKSLQKSIQKISKKIITFWISFGPIFGGFWPPTSTSKGVQRNGFWRSWGGLGPSWIQDGPQTSPRGPWDRFWSIFGPTLVDFWTNVVDFRMIFGTTFNNF